MWKKTDSGRRTGVLDERKKKQWSNGLTTQQLNGAGLKGDLRSRGEHVGD